MNPKLNIYNTADAALDALQESGISYLFSNLGSDHPAFIEGFAKAKAQNRSIPEVIICPHEYVAVSAAHGYYQLTGEPQGVFVHTDVGTQNIGGSLHNASRSRIPIFIFSGETPSTMEGELPGSRNSYINYLQNVYDQRGIIRSYVKWDYDIRTGKNVKQLVYRAIQLANSDPKGPVYLTGTREVLEEEVEPSLDFSAKWKPIEKNVLPPSAVKKIVNALIAAEEPVLVTTAVGRNVESVEELIKFCEKLAIPVVESNSVYMNFPNNHPLHQGFTGGERISKADVVVVIDSDVPWVPTLSRPNEGSQVFFIDIDPLKEHIPLWHGIADGFYQADSYQALQQMNEFLNQLELDQEVIAGRYERLRISHLEQRAEWAEKEKILDDGIITPEWLTACLNRVVDDDTIIINESITNTLAFWQHLPRNKPGTSIGNGGSSLGWGGGAAFGAKLAKPGETIVHLTGDGSYLFSIPSSVYWMSRRYNAPFLTVIYNNQGWNATKNNLLRVHPEGIAQRDDRYWVNFDQPADLAKIAEAAGGALAITVSDPEKLQEALKTGIDAVQNGKTAVIDVRIATISNQKD
ncbi:thiamine pyrophosphate-requiring protein [Salibacterium aidingense]|uniref:thiamine pyrophosphate-requiring protein n=1 Tax=Salibacterium aidingense TaxID=384933 RepID=UPI003BE6D70D